MYKSNKKTAYRSSMTSLICLIILVLLSWTAHGNVELEVTLRSYSNPTNQFMANNGLICCDIRSSLSGDEICTEAERCDNYFTFCLRELSASSQSTNDCLTPRIVSSINIDAAPLNFSLPTVLGLPNPLTLVFNPTDAFTGVQLFVLVVDSDEQDAGSINSDDLVDFFISNISPEALNGATQDLTLPGSLGLGTLSISTRLNCAEFYIGDQCELLDHCRQNSITCSGNGQCVNDNTTFTCECVPGYTGPLCGEPLGVPIVEIATGVTGGVLLIFVITLALTCVICLTKRSETAQGKSQRTNTRLTTNDAYGTRIQVVSAGDNTLGHSVDYVAGLPADHEYDYPQAPLDDNPLYASVEESSDTLGGSRPS